MTSEPFTPPDTAPAADLPQHARERLSEMRKRHFFTSDLSVNEFLLVKQAGFEPLGLVMGSSIYHVRPGGPRNSGLLAGSIGALDSVSGEVTAMSEALYHARELAMTRMEEEADALGADGIVAVRLEVNLLAWGERVLEFIAIGTAVKHRGEDFRNALGKPFTSSLSGQDFWTLLKAGYRPAGMVMGNCVYYLDPGKIMPFWSSRANAELTDGTHALYEARELAMERMQAEAEALGATGIVGVEVDEKHHHWRSLLGASAYLSGELLELFIIGNAVVPSGLPPEVHPVHLVIPTDR